MKDSLLYAANWKMYLSFNQEMQFFNAHKKQLIELSQQSTIALLPSFVSLVPLAQELKSTHLKLGAQDCSSELPGAYTGQVPAQSLSQIGCSYCLVGHSELRKLGQSTDQIVQKIIRLYEQKVTPIVCVGETEAEYKQDKTTHVIRKQLLPILEIPYLKKIIIAYEPAWAIGTDKTPHAHEITDVFSYLSSCIKDADNNVEYMLLYGGSVSQSNIKEFKKIPGIGGFLIGHNSLDFQEFEKIVSL